MHYHPVILSTIDVREGTRAHAEQSAKRFAQLNGVLPQVVTREDIGETVNRYWYSAWIWDVVPEDVEYVLCMDGKVLPARTLPKLPELKFAAIMDRHDRVNQGKLASKIVRGTGKYFQMHVFIAHRDTRPLFEQLKVLSRDVRYGAHASELGADGRGNFTPMNDVIQANVPVYELPRSWNWLIAYEKQYYYDWPYMINFNANAHGTWAYLRYIRSLFAYIESLGGSLESADNGV